MVIVAEELPASARGWGIGMLAAVSAAGHGLGASLFGAIELLPYGWRSLYAFGCIPLLLLPLFRHGIKETARFAEHQAAGKHLQMRWWKPLADFLNTHPVRAAGMALVASLAAVGHSVVMVLPVTTFCNIAVGSRTNWRSCGAYPDNFFKHDRSRYVAAAVSGDPNARA